MRAGDHVLHRPTGEQWLVACVDGDDLMWCGWPDGRASVGDCELLRAATDDEHRAMLEAWSEKKRFGGGDRRVRICGEQLFNEGFIGAGI